MEILVVALSQPILSARVMAGIVEDELEPGGESDMKDETDLGKAAVTEDESVTEDGLDAEDKSVVNDEYISGLCDRVCSDRAGYLLLCNIPRRTRDGPIPFPANNSIEDHVRWSIAVRKRATVRNEGTAHSTRGSGVVVTTHLKDNIYYCT